MPRDDDEPGADALARRLARVHLDLAHAADESDLLAAVAQALAPYGPSIVDLHYLDVDAHDVPLESWPVAVWTRELPAFPHSLRDRRLRLADFPLARLWIASPAQALVIADVVTDPRCDDVLRAMLAPRRAMIVLPLRSAHPERWQGILTVHWSDRHTPGPEERLVHRLLMHTVAASIADRRALAAHTAALAEIQALYRHSTRINEAADPAELLAAVVAEVRSPGVQGQILAIETGPSGQPQELEVLAVHGSTAVLGARFAVAASRSARLWIARPDEALMIADVAADARLAEPGAARLDDGLATMILLPLRRNDRWLGLLQLGWTTPRSFDDDERRLYESLAPQLAAVLDNRLLVARSTRAMADSKAQARTLGIVLDHLPIGVMIVDGATGKHTLNRTGAQLLASEAPEVREPPLYHPDSERPVGADERLSRRALATGELVSSERDFLGHDGTRRRLTVTAAPFRDAEGGILGTVTLFHDITQHVLAEQERERLKAAVIAAQSAALAERATPLIPMTDDVLVLPIVGAIDPERGRQLLATLVNLEGHTRVVLIDLTGVRALDGAGAQALTLAVSALRLRGVAAFLTGVGDEVAWALVERNLDLRGLVTHGTLRDGLAHATRHR